MNNINFKIVIALFVISSISYAQNLGKVDYPWTVTSMSDHSWNTALVYKVKKTKKIYRAMSEIEQTINADSNFQLIKLGAIRKCIIVSIRNYKNESKVYSNLSDATKYAELEYVVNRQRWQRGNRYQKPMAEKYDSRSSNLNQCR